MLQANLRGVPVRGLGLPSRAVVTLGCGSVRYASTKQLAQQRAKVQLAREQKRAEARKEAAFRAEARNAIHSPNCMKLDLALRFLRAAEVGRTPHATTISLNMRIVAERGAVPINTKCRLPSPLDQQRICVFTNSSEQAAEARQAGASVVGSDDIIEQVKSGVINFDRAYATPDIVPRLTQIARILGPKGLMPSAKRGTVTNDIAKTLSEAQGEMTFKQLGTSLHVPVGRASFTDLEVARNIVTVTDAVRDFIKQSATTASAKTAYIGRTVITSTTGPSIVIEV